jgi:hypothetical protein
MSVWRLFHFDPYRSSGHIGRSRWWRTVADVQKYSDPARSRKHQGHWYSIPHREWAFQILKHQM